MTLQLRRSQHRIRQDVSTLFMWIGYILVIAERLFVRLPTIIVN